jgi:arylsulfatase A-like enzyme
MKKAMLMAALAPAAISFHSCQPSSENSSTSDDTKPNIIVIFTDDLGYGDIGCFGATDIKTPHIDQMAEEGMKLTSFYSASPVCSPSRAGLLTGRYPQRMGINGVFFPDSHTGLSVDEVTIADVLSAEGYKTAMIGKWHLGHLHQYMPLQRGFDEHFGMPYSNDMESYYYYRGNKVEGFEIDQSLITKRLTEESLDFIEKHKKQPFFLYLAHPMPHVPIYASQDFKGKSNRGLYGDVIEELDWSVGQIVNKLSQEGLLENTLVIFTSDNGPWLVMREMGGSSGILREGKQFTFEGGMRVPTLAMWKGKIPAGSEYNDMALMMDWMPTFASLADAPLPQNTPLDGTDISDVLMGKKSKQEREFLFFDGSKLEGYRKGKWKVKLAFDGFEGARWKKAVAPHPLSLFDLEKDPGETKNLAVENPEKVEEMLAEMENAKAKLGELPPSLVLRSPADVDFYDELIDKHGRGHWKDFEHKENSTNEE